MHEREVCGVDEVLDRPERIGAERVGTGMEDAESAAAPFRESAGHRAAGRRASAQMKP